MAAAGVGAMGDAQAEALLAAFFARAAARTCVVARATAEEGACNGHSLRTSMDAGNPIHVGPPKG